MPRTGLRIYLSPPTLEGSELELLSDALDSGWIAPLGPHVDRFEEEFAEIVGARHALALSSGTGALHLALLTQGVRPGDRVCVSALTFCGSVNPILYCGAEPVFIDSEPRSWNMDPRLLRETLRRYSEAGEPVKAVVLVHLYGQAADVEPVRAACSDYGAVLVEDAAEALGTTYEGRHVGSAGAAGIFSFNGNKLITTSGGGMLVSPDPEVVKHARKLATQAREEGRYYEHREVGFNYRMSNLLAAVGRAQLRDLGPRLDRRREVFQAYSDALADRPGISFMAEAPWGHHARWLTTLLVDEDRAGVTPGDLCEALAARGIEARPVWKPMHLQPVYRDFEAVGGDVAEELFAQGLCLPSGTELTPSDISEIVDVVDGMLRRVGS
jgi:dTDP-4-amino-4,6-dideoxygalactose transaminase